MHFGLHSQLYLLFSLLFFTSFILLLIYVPSLQSVLEHGDTNEVHKHTSVKFVSIFANPVGILAHQYPTILRNIFLIQTSLVF